MESSVPQFLTGFLVGLQISIRATRSNWSQTNAASLSESRKFYVTASTAALQTLAVVLPVDLLPLNQITTHFCIRCRKDFFIGEVEFHIEEYDKVIWTLPNPWASESREYHGHMEWKVEGSPKRRTTYEYFLDVRNIFRINWILLNHQVTQLPSGHGNFCIYHNTFAIQQDDTCDCDLQESETILHLLNDCSHPTEGRRRLPLCLAAARATVDLLPALVFWVQRTTFLLFLVLTKSVQGNKTQAVQGRQ